MEKRRPGAGTVVLIVLLLALTGVCVYLGAPYPGRLSGIPHGKRSDSHAHGG